MLYLKNSYYAICINGLHLSKHDNCGTVNVRHFQSQDDLILYMLDTSGLEKITPEEFVELITGYEVRVGDTMEIISEEHGVHICKLCRVGYGKYMLIDDLSNRYDDTIFEWNSTKTIMVSDIEKFYNVKVNLL